MIEVVEKICEGIYFKKLTIKQTYVILQFYDFTQSDNLKFIAFGVKVIHFTASICLCLSFLNQFYLIASLK